MISEFDHVGYVVRDLDQARATFAAFEMTPAVELELPQFSLRLVFLAAGQAKVELIEFTDVGLRDRRLGGQSTVLDHVAYAVDDIAIADRELRRRGARIIGPDGSPLDGPLELGGARHLWIESGDDGAISTQLIQRL
jgi:catechol 2,3-dioxygenase-like lactoylglutathione lyase family enzyme